MYTKEVIMITVAKEELDQINSLKLKLASTVSDSGQLALQIQMMELETVELKSRVTSDSDSPVLSGGLRPVLEKKNNSVAKLCAD